MEKFSKRIVLIIILITFAFFSFLLLSCKRKEPLQGYNSMAMISKIYNKGAIIDFSTVFPQIDIPVLVSGDSRAIIYKNLLLQTIINDVKLPGKIISYHSDYFYDTKYYYFICSNLDNNYLLCFVSETRDDSLKKDPIFEFKLNFSLRIDSKMFVAFYDDPKQIICLSATGDTLKAYDYNGVFLHELKFNKKILTNSKLSYADGEAIYCYDGESLHKIVPRSNELTLTETFKLSKKGNLSKSIFKAKSASWNTLTNNIALYDGSRLYYFNTKKDKIVFENDCNITGESLNYNLFPTDKGLFFIDYEETINQLQKVIIEKPLIPLTTITIGNTICFTLISKEELGNRLVTYYIHNNPNGNSSLSNFKTDLFVGEITNFADAEGTFFIYTDKGIFIYKRPIVIFPSDDLIEVESKFD